MDAKVKNACFSLAALGFDFACPGGERIRTLLGDIAGFSDKPLTRQEFLQNLALLPVDVLVETVIAPKVIGGILKGIKNIPKVKKVAKGICKVFEECKETRLAAGKVVGKVGKKTGTVWDYIKMTDVFYKSTKIPRSFELTVGSKKFWVNPNATKHMLEYLISDRNPVTHGIPIDSQTLLKSFKATVEKALEIGFVYDQAINLDCWHLVFSAPRVKGLLPVIKHAIYRP